VRACIYTQREINTKKRVVGDKRRIFRKN